MDKHLQTIETNVEALKAAGRQCGVDVEALCKKYAGGRSVQDGKNYGHSDEDMPPLKLDALNNLIICKRCHGLGLIKEHYNHQVKDVNCNECGGDGTIDTKAKTKQLSAWASCCTKIVML